jgi:hypothetical protein
MAFRFSDGDRWSDLGRSLWHRFRGGPRAWHNRVFTASQSIEPAEDGWSIRWPGRGAFRARDIRDLKPAGPLAQGGMASILASGPSIHDLVRPDRLFLAPVACVNGSVALANALGRRASYYIVSDYRFVLDQPDLFRLGVSLADAVVISPVVAFAALLAAPAAVHEWEARSTPVFLREDLLRPFKRPRPTREELRHDPRVLCRPGSDIVFSLDPTRGLASAGTVVYDVIQLLFGIGYRELFMFGVDLSAAPRFHGDGTSRRPELAAAYDRAIAPAFALVRDYLDQFEGVLVNGSARSRLPAEVVPKVAGNELLDLLEWRSRSGHRQAASTRTAA